MPADFGYINARVKGMRSRLLPPGRLEELLGLPDLDAFLQALVHTPYGPELQEALTRYQGLRAVDEALARAFQKAARRVLSFADGKPRTLIQVLLMQWDVHNLRAVLRAKHAGYPPEAVEPTLVPAAELSDVRLRELLQQPDVPAVLATLATWAHPLAEALTAALAEYYASKDLLVLELALDRAYYTWALQAARGRGYDASRVAELVRTQLDFTNVKTAFKLQQLPDLAPEQREQFFLEGGAVVSREVFRNLADPRTAEVGIREIRARGIQPEGRTPAEVERWLEHEAIRRMADLYLGDPLGVDVVVGYLTLLANEVRNLRLIARSKAVGIPRDLVRREMALV
ncbi:MAG: V-type ATPase subunit [Armatimonadota bacterium]|nr:V-type ATPase subunit [Armatimonadota bacterium]MDR7446279.1 V-type ATPase subunit [Armatimonadota bacterium]MDR7577722.1 V-type ATPase subunit [Armatimonadota bacterium]MDR7579728.1 V-type ATPase subunit [Armatimonadota bacterium]